MMPRPAACFAMPDAPSGPESHALPTRGNRETLLEVLTPVAGRSVVDIGCGDGTWTRFLTQAGARVTGIEPGHAMMERARAADPAGDETYVEAGAQSLPLADASQDIALFFNSLHHVPVDLMDAAVAEAARVTRPGGLIVAFEPVARGATYQLNQPVDDEAEVRAQAHRCLHAAAESDGRLALDQEFEYVTLSRKRDFDAWRDWQVAIGPARAARFEAAGEALRRHFDAIVASRPRDDEGFFLLDQPMRATVLRRRTT